MSAVVPACICRCPQADHDPAPGLHGCHCCRCFGYRPSAEIARWYEGQDSVDLIRKERCGRCGYTIGRGEFRRHGRTIRPGDLLVVRGGEYTPVNVDPTCMICEYDLPLCPAWANAVDRPAPTAVIEA